MEIICQPYKAGGDISRLYHGRKHADDEKEDTDGHRLFGPLIDSLPETVILSFFHKHGPHEKPHKGSHGQRIHLKCLKDDKIEDAEKEKDRNRKKSHGPSAAKFQSFFCLRVFLLLHKNTSFLFTLPHSGSST